MKDQSCPQSPFILLVKRVFMRQNIRLTDFLLIQESSVFTILSQELKKLQVPIKLPCITSVRFQRHRLFISFRSRKEEGDTSRSWVMVAHARAVKSFSQTFRTYS